MAKRTFQGMNYRELQKANSQTRSQLSKESQTLLKASGLKNTGWDNVIALYQRIQELLDSDRVSEDLSLEELFLEVDRIGKKYQTQEEIEEFNQKLAKEVAEIGELVDRQFPDTEPEIIDFSKPKPRR
ncbi:MAG: hypothetical protein J0L70_04545 [Leptolyngbya sp. UWPOB_LEPTO1]|uniref:hypothetical protein n=1 Tax=Leptolyngbya sp. UWPOB_LEPTO1 TaxID=2815653 RepID=UPI001AC8B73A|nr:hypothetical protein [Leptolyngbya sp. UWPOB_LEPTO1]MBN8559771.1 hypothetical protein [Leptolyngbya sp. UWPOB_LEPTO1]